MTDPIKRADWPEKIYIASVGVHRIAIRHPIEGTVEYTLSELVADQLRAAQRKAIKSTLGFCDVFLENGHLKESFSLQIDPELILENLK